VPLSKGDIFPLQLLRSSCIRRTRNTHWSPKRSTRIAGEAIQESDRVEGWHFDIDSNILFNSDGTARQPTIAETQVRKLEAQVKQMKERQTELSAKTDRQEAEIQNLVSTITKLEHDANILNSQSETCKKQLELMKQKRYNTA
jgi:seryl-tRNA synthetase